MIESAYSKAWETLAVVIKESPAKTYTKSQVLGLMARVLREAFDSQTLRHLDMACQQAMGVSEETL